MAETAAETTSAPSPVTLEGGTYEIIRRRLTAGGDKLHSRLDQLNQSRKDIFGSIEATILATERISTQYNCIPRDIAPVTANRFILGYNVYMGLKSEIRLEDVFSVYEYRERQFYEQSVEILHSGRFEADFKDLYKYYKDTRFARFSIIGPHLFMVFYTNKSGTDIKVFKWAVQDAGIVYIDNRSDHELKLPPQHEFVWTRATRDQHRAGKHPHVSLQDRLFVEAVGGDITFKVEDNTDDGFGIYAEPVEHKDQTLDDAEINYAFVGNMILVRIRPYQESKFRYFIFNEKTQVVSRVDEIENACVLLPDHQGLIFSNGYYLQTGELKQFESQLSDLRFEKRIASANGEDYLYVFYQRGSGDHILLHYNSIAQKVEIPLLCSGFSAFDNGEFLIFKSEPEPTKHHVIQVRQTPFVSSAYAGAEKKEAFLYKVGNKDIVRCMAECNELLRLVNKEDTYAGLYHDIVKKAGNIADSYFWIDKPEAFRVKESILEIKATAAGAIDEFEKVMRLKKNTADQVNRVTETAQQRLKQIDLPVMNRIDLFVNTLADLRNIRGAIISLTELRYADLSAIAALETQAADAMEQVSLACVGFLLTDEALLPYIQRVAQTHRHIDGLTKVTDADQVQQEVDASARELEMLIDIVSNLKIEDSTHSTRIIENISEIYASLNQVKAELKNKRKALLSVEGVAQFNAQVKLLNQSVINYLDVCDTPDKCDEYLTKMLIQVEELEGRFVDFEDFLLQLAEKREELQHAFETRKLALVEARSKRANALMSAAQRILKGIAHRIAGMEDLNAINGYFAGDLMIDKIRDIARQLLALDDSVKADDIQSRLKTLREDAARQLKDRKELFVDGANVIRFGEHQFSVNVQPLDLTIVQKDGKQVFHLTGTNFFEPIQDADFMDTKPVWRMELPSENEQVYRAEFLAWRMLNQVDEFSAMSEPELAAQVQQFMGARYSEGYMKGAHDRDAAKILSVLSRVHAQAETLRFHPQARSLARLCWRIGFSPDEAEEQAHIQKKLAALGLIADMFPRREAQERHLRELSRRLSAFVTTTGLFPEARIPEAARYLFAELTTGAKFWVSKEAVSLADRFLVNLKTHRCLEKFTDARRQIAAIAESEYDLIRDWVEAFIISLQHEESLDYQDEVALLMFLPPEVRRRDLLDLDMTQPIGGLIGDHPVIQQGQYHFNYYRFAEKLQRHDSETAPLFQRYQRLKRQLTDNLRESLRLDEFKPRVLTSFVRNRLINKVYLPLIGNNLAKQIGVVGEHKRTDLMGMLLLISPPGYGKTTLMEYLANRLGVIFMKINGPAIGHGVTSLDPQEAPNASAREEISKLNLALEMGDNVMLYLDDIQHLNPEFLQKFISLCDAQRKIEGVYKGKSRTYDLRGKKVVVVMAGNPYTESGEKFKIPDMLANRADTYNLGDIIGDTREEFEMSYLENALTSNPILNKLAVRSQQDVYAVIQLAKQGNQEGIEFQANYAAEELQEMVLVMKKMIATQEIILKVNQEYIRSASQADEYRTEPPFKLQGSYRNMNRIAEKIMPVMNDQELRTLILSYYENESQTLTTGAEANMLKFLELTGWLDEAQQARWGEIKRIFKKNQLLRGLDEANPVTQVVGQLSAFQDGLEAIQQALTGGVSRLAQSHERLAEAQIAAQTAPPPELSETLLSPVPTLVSFSEETLARIEKALAEIKGLAALNQDSQASRIIRSSPIAPSTLRNIHKMPGNHFYMTLKSGDLNALKKLVENGRNVNARTPEGATPLMAATVHDHPLVVDFLIKHGADINAQDKDGYTALMIAASKGRPEIVKLLLAQGANVNILDKNGMTSLMWAEKNGHEAVAKLLKGKPN